MGMKVLTGEMRIFWNCFMVKAAPVGKVTKSLICALEV